MSQRTELLPCRTWCLRTRNWTCRISAWRNDDKRKRVSDFVLQVQGEFCVDKQAGPIELTSKDSYIQVETATSPSTEHCVQARHHYSVYFLADSMDPTNSSERDTYTHISTCRAMELELQAETVFVTNFHPTGLMRPMSKRREISSMMTQVSPHSGGQRPIVLPLSKQ